LCALEAAAWTRSWLETIFGTSVEVLSSSLAVGVPNADPRSLRTLPRSPEGVEDPSTGPYRVVVYPTSPKISKVLKFGGNPAIERCEREAKSDHDPVHLRWIEDAKWLYAIAAGAGTSQLYRALDCLDAWAKQVTKRLSYQLEPFYVPPLWRWLPEKTAEGDKGA
jgi:hypothetical protein